MRKMRSYDILGNVALVRFPKEFKKSDKLRFGKRLLNDNNSIKSVFEKKGKVRGRLRKQELSYVVGDKTNEVLYKENDCVFRFNLDSTYFSPRLSNERKEIANQIKKDENVLVMFAGVGPFSLVIAKNSKCKKVVSVEINREASKYALMNVKRNNLTSKVEVVQGDVKKFVGKLGSLRSRFIGSTRAPTSLLANKFVKVKTLAQTLSRGSQGKDVKVKLNQSRVSIGGLSDLPTTYDVIVMPRPQLKETFLKEAFVLSKKGTRIFYYDFCKQDEIKMIIEKVKQEAKKARKKIKVLKIKNAGEIAPYRFRIRVDFCIL